MAGVAAAAAIGSAAIGAGVSASNASAASGATDKAIRAQQLQFARTQQALNDANTKAQANLDPYAQAGLGAQNELSWGMGTATPTAGYQGNGAQGNLLQPVQTYQPYTQAQYQNDPLYTPMVNSLQDLQNTPGYQFQLQQGLDSANNSAAAQGSLLSGAQLKSLNNYAQGQASTGYQAAWNRAQQAYQQAFNNNMSQQTTKFDQGNTNRQSNINLLTGQANQGANVANNQANYNMQTGTALAGAGTSNANNISNLSLQQGANQQNANNGYANAATTLISGLQNAFSKPGTGKGGGTNGGINPNNTASGNVGANGLLNESFQGAGY